MLSMERKTLSIMGFFLEFASIPCISCLQADGYEYRAIAYGSSQDLTFRTFT
jgi:hypothetical protein